MALPSSNLLAKKGVYTNGMEDCIPMALMQLTLTCVQKYLTRDFQLGVVIVNFQIRKISAQAKSLPIGKIYTTRK